MEVTAYPYFVLSGFKNRVLLKYIYYEN